MSPPHSNQPLVRRLNPRERPVERTENAVTTRRGSVSLQPAVVDSDVCAQPIDDERADGRPARYACPLDPKKLDPDAAKVVRRLVRHGYEAYLVGGCVRDLLLGRTPKDFDVCTSAQPDDVQRLFRNCRIIGRRFRLAHVFFSGGKVIETATFRRNPTSEEKTGDQLLIRRDNFFGRADEDALRRDFTINALFYDLEAKEVIDWCGGVEDLQRRAVRTIGDPIVRFLEDPVRMLRAIKFSSRLDLGMTPSVYHAIVQCRGALAMAARPRLFEEVLRLLRGGASQTSIWLCWETGVLDVLLPEVSTYLYDRPVEDGTFWELLSALDAWTEERGEPPDDIVLWTCLLFEPLLEACAGEPDSAGAASDFLEPIIERLNVPRRVADAVRRIVAQLPRLYAGRPGRFSRTPLYAPACEVLALLGEAHPKLDAYLQIAPRKKRRRKTTSRA
jgi:poly(A) polymerase